MNLRSQIQSEIDTLKVLERGTPLWASLVGGGIDESLLKRFLANGRRKKIGNAPCPDGLIHKLLESGGLIAGGRAVSSFLGGPANGDYDIFFNDFGRFVEATILTQNDPSIDVCYYRTTPWELFDIDASCCSIGTDERIISSAEFDKTWGTGTSGLSLGNIIQPVATLNRVIKYGDRWGIRFRTSDILYVATVFGVHDTGLIGRALKHAD